MKKRRAHKPVAAQSASEKIWGRIWHYLLVVLVGLLLAAGIWGHGAEVTVGGATFEQAQQLESVSHAWAWGQTWPQVDPEAYQGFGYAYGVFMGPLVSYLGAGLQVVLGSWSAVLNMLLILALVGAGIMMCYAVTRISKQRTMGAVAGICYMAMPYCLGVMYVWGAVSELLALMVAPLLLLGLYQLTTQRTHAVRTLALAFTLLLLTQSELAILFGLATGLYVLLALPKLCNWESWWRLLLAVVVTLGLAAVWLVPLMEAWWLGDYGFFDTGYLARFAGLDGASWNQQTIGLTELLLNNGTGLTLGLVALFALVGFWFARAKIEDRTERYYVTILYVLGTLAAILILPFVNWDGMAVAWLRLNLPKQCLAVTSLMLSVVAAYTVQAVINEWDAVRQRVVVALLGVVLVGTNTGTILAEREYINLDRMGWDELQTRNQLVTSGETGLPVVLGCRSDECDVTSVQAALRERGAGVKVLKGEATLKNVVRSGLELSWQVEKVNSNAVIELPLIYYPGYQVELNGGELAVQVSELGLVAVALPKDAVGSVKVWYGISMGAKIGIGLTAMTAGLSLLWLMFDYLRGLRRAKENAEAEMVMSSVKAAVESAKQAAERELAMENLMLTMPTEPVKPKRGRPRKTEAKAKAAAEVANQAAEVKAKAKKAKSTSKSTSKGGKK